MWTGLEPTPARTGVHTGTLRPTARLVQQKRWCSGFQAVYIPHPSTPVLPNSRHLTKLVPPSADKATCESADSSSAIMLGNVLRLTVLFWTIVILLLAMGVHNQ